MLSSISFIYSRKSNGPRTEPWGTPLNTLAHSELIPSKQTRRNLLFNQLLIHSNSLPLIPYLSNLYNSRSCRTLSNAFAKSRYITSIAVPVSTPSETWSKKDNNDKHDRPVLKPCYESVSTLYLSRYSITLSRIIASSNLQH